MADSFNETEHPDGIHVFSYRKQKKYIHEQYDSFLKHVTQAAEKKL